MSLRLAKPGESYQPNRDLKAKSLNIERFSCDRHVDCRTCVTFNMEASMPRQSRNPEIQRHAAEKQDELNKAQFLNKKGILAQDRPDTKHEKNEMDSPPRKARSDVIPPQWRR